QILPVDAFKATAFKLHYAMSACAGEPLGGPGMSAGRAVCRCGHPSAFSFQYGDQIMHRSTFIALITAWIFIAGAIAETGRSEETNNAFNELSSEMTECSVYFLLASTCFARF